MSPLTPRTTSPTPLLAQVVGEQCSIVLEEFRKLNSVYLLVSCQLLIGVKVEHEIEVLDITIK